MHVGAREATVRLNGSFAGCYTRRAGVGGISVKVGNMKSCAIASLLRVTATWAACTSVLFSCRPAHDTSLPVDEGAKAADADAGQPAPTRIVSMAPNLTEILFALELDDEIVGVSDFCNYPPAAVAKPKVGGVLNPDIEAILALEPDLVVNIPGSASRTVVAQLEGLGIRTAVINARTVDETFAAIESLGRLTGRREQAAALANRMRAELDEIKTRVRTAPRRKTLFVVSANPLRVAGGTTFIDDLIEIAGGSNIARGALGKYPQLGLEEIIARQPEVIIDSTLGPAFSETAAAERHDWWRQWDAIPAVATGRIYELDTDVLIRPGPRMSEAALILARAIHPEVFEGNGDR